MQKIKEYGELKDGKDIDLKKMGKEIAEYAFSSPDFPIHYYQANPNMTIILNQKFVGQIPFSSLLVTKELK